MKNEPQRKKINIKEKDLKIQKPLEDFISDKGFTVSSIDKDKKSFYDKINSEEYLIENGETKGESKQPNIIGKPFRTIIRGKTASD